MALDKLLVPRRTIVEVFPRLENEQVGEAGMYMVVPTRFTEVSGPASTIACAASVGAEETGCPFVSGLCRSSDDLHGLLPIIGCSLTIYYRCLTKVDLMSRNSWCSWDASRRVPGKKSKRRSACKSLRHVLARHRRIMAGPSAQKRRHGKRRHQ